MSIIPKNEHKLRIGIVFGGKSAEHEVSIQSAQNIYEAIDKNKFEPMLIAIDKDGKWALRDSNMLIPHGSNAAPNQAAHEITLALGENKGLIVSDGNSSFKAPDVIFPILHGPLGEDGAVQGLLELLGIPYVGAGVLGSAVGMDKDVMKRLLHESGIPITKHIVLKDYEELCNPKMILEEMDLPLFVKPANMGSSIGVSKAENEEELLQAIKLAFQYDRKVLIEKTIDGEEVECAILGNEQPHASMPGRIIVRTDFYNYSAKYNASEGTAVEIPANFSQDLQIKIQETAIKAYKVLECQGMARVDMFVTKQGEVLVNEINTLPGFTKLSVYPKLWEANGLSYTDLITKLIYLAVDRASKRNKLLT